MGDQAGMNIGFGGRIGCEVGANGAKGIAGVWETDKVKRSTRNANASAVVAAVEVVVAAVVVDGTHYNQVDAVHTNFVVVGSWDIPGIAQVEVGEDTSGIAVDRMDEAHIEAPPEDPAGS